MAKLGINTGVSPNDNLGDTLLEGAIKINTNFTEIYNYFGNGSSLTSGVLNKTSVGVNTLSNIGIGTTNPTSKLHVFGDGIFSGIVTAQSFSGNASLTNLNGTNLNFSGISTLGTIRVSSGIVTSTSGVVTYYGDGSKLTGIVATSGIATISGVLYAVTAGVATYATNAGIATYATKAGIATYANTAGIATYANTAGIASVAVGFGTTSSINTTGIITASNFKLSSGTGYVGFSTFETLTSGTSWTVPQGVYLIKVYATGGGGGGGYIVASGNYVFGGHGATAISYYKVTPGASATYSIGSAGIGTNNGYGTRGGNTTFTYNSTTITGVGGTSVFTNPPPIATGGQINLYGGSASMSNWSTQPVTSPITGYGLGGGGAAVGSATTGAIILEY